MKIGFFGDSFCADLQSGTYLQLLATHYGADVVNVGYGGSSIWDVLLLQIDPFIKKNNIPDICVFVWTEPTRLFHQVLRNINFTTAVTGTYRSTAGFGNVFPMAAGKGDTYVRTDSLPNQLYKFNGNKWIEVDTHTAFQKYLDQIFPPTEKSYEIIYDAARDYYLHLQNTELDQYRFTAALHYFDTVILPTFPNNTKIVHLWSFGVEQGFWHPFHTWKNGVEIHPGFTSIMERSGVMPKEMHEHVYNHVPLGKKFDPTNSMIFNLIKDAIDQQ